jgi:hypothetical protein
VAEFLGAGLFFGFLNVRLDKPNFELIKSSAGLKYKETNNRKKKHQLEI